MAAAASAGGGGSAATYAPMASEEALARPAPGDTEALKKYLTGKAEFSSHRSRCLFAPPRAAITLGPYAVLELEIVEARDLHVQHEGFIERTFGDKPDAFVKILLNDVLLHERGQTERVNNTCEPKWNFKTRVDVTCPKSVIRLHCYDHDLASKPDPIGFVEFSVGDLPWDEEIDGWLELAFPEFLQGENTTRIDKRKEKRYEEIHKEERDAASLDKKKADAAAKQAKKDAAAPAHAPQEPLLSQRGEAPGGGSEGGPAAKHRSSKVGRLFRGFKHAAEGTMHQAAATAESGARSAATAAESALHRAEEAVVHKRAPPPVRHNGGEVRVRARLSLHERCTGADAAVALTMDAPCQDFASFVQVEDLPQLDFQELADDAMDIKIKVLDDVIISVVAYCWYILCWRRWLFSFIWFAMFTTVCLSGLFFNDIDPHHALASVVWHAGLLILLVCNARKVWRDEMTTGSWNASCDQEGFERVAGWNSTWQMNGFLARCVLVNQGEIHDSQELYEFAGMCFMYGKPLCSFAELMKVLHSDSVHFVSFSSAHHLKEHSLIYVDERQRGTVVELEGEMVRVEFDEDAVDGVHAREELVEASRVTHRLSVPTVPRALLPTHLITAFRLAIQEVDLLKKKVVPTVNKINGIFAWREDCMRYTLAIVAWLTVKAVIALLDFLGFPLAVLLVRTMYMVRNCLLVLVFFLICFSHSPPFIVLMNLGKIVYRKLTMKREAPKGWAFFKPYAESA